jgi:hypothetical protein
MRVFGYVGIDIVYGLIILAGIMLMNRVLNRLMVHESRGMVLLGRVLLVMFGLMALILYGSFVPRVWVSTRQVEQRVKSALPVGTSKADAEAWLSSQGDIQFKWYIGKQGTGQITGLEGVIRNTGPYLSWPEEIQIYLYFEDGELSRVEVREQHFPF